MCQKCAQEHKNMLKCRSLPELRQSMRRLDMIGYSNRQSEASAHRIYNKGRVQTPSWHPVPGQSDRPKRYQYVPSAAALSFNYAFEQYHQGHMPGVSSEGAFNRVIDVYNKIRPSKTFQPHNFSYNLS